MSSQLGEAVLRRDREGVGHALTLLGDGDNWSLATIIDELIPLMLMETHLRYSNFHLVKMGLFLRRMALEGVFSKDTERAVARLVALEVIGRDWVAIHASGAGVARRATPSWMTSMLTELDAGNVHNAFYYALGLLKETPAALMQTLLTLGADAMPHSLGHTLSCFFPVVEDIISVGHPDAASALLSYLMYLGRFEVNREAGGGGEGRIGGPVDYDSLLKLCASGDGIVNLHHTITLYVTMAWERAVFNASGAVPYAVLTDWVGEKPLDQGRAHRVADLKLAGDLPATYEAFRDGVSLEVPDELLSWLIRLLAEAPDQAIDWIFRFYASQYAYGSWNPHYFTGLYAALRLYTDPRVHGDIARRMALDQALRYFATGLAS